MASEPRLRAGIHARRSLNRNDEQSASVRRQFREGRALAARIGAKVVKEWDEDDTSAFKKRVVTLPDGRRVRRNVRPDWQDALRCLYDGTIDVLIEYDLDRAMREPRDLEDLIEVIEATGRQVESVNGNLRLRNDDEITMARVMVAMANKSSRDTSRRVRDDARDRAVAGKNHGGRRCFGYTPDGLHLVPAEAGVIAWMADELLRGTPLGSITRTLNDQPIIDHLLQNRAELDAHPEAETHLFLLRWADGLTVDDIADRLKIRRDRVSQLSANVVKRHRKLLEGRSLPGLYRTVTGRPWTPSTVRDLLTRPRLAGLSVHQGKVVGKGQWPAILTVEQHHAIVALVADPSRRTTTGNRAAYLLSGLAKCGVCGNSVTSFGIKRSGTATPRALYRCRTNACAAVRRELADLYIEERVFERLSRPDAAELLVDQKAPDVDALRTEAHAIRVRLDEAAASFARPDGIDARQLEIITKSLNGRLREIDQLRQHTSRAPVLRELIEAGERMPEVWAGMTLDRRRAVVACLMTVEILPGGSGKREFDAERKIRVTPKE